MFFNRKRNREAAPEEEFSSHVPEAARMILGERARFEKEFPALVSLSVQIEELAKLLHDSSDYLETNAVMKAAVENAIRECDKEIQRVLKEANITITITTVNKNLQATRRGVLQKLGSLFSWLKPIPQSGNPAPLFLDHPFRVGSHDWQREQKSTADHKKVSKPSFNLALVTVPGIASGPVPKRIADLQNEAPGSARALFAMYMGKRFGFEVKKEAAHAPAAPTAPKPKEANKPAAPKPKEKPQAEKSHH